MSTNVTKTFLPPLEEYEQYLAKIWESGHITNKGPLLRAFEDAMKHRLGVENFQLVANGTLALQIALKSMDITDGEVITTPFSYVATTSAILWEGCTPVYVDITPDTLCIDANKIEAAITDQTKAILAVHVFGHACDVEQIDAIAKKHKLKVIYDAAHAFGVEYKGKSLLDNGDISICSFHATKLFHTIEGGCVIAKEKEVDHAVDLIKRFGHNGDEHFRLGINAKATDFQAAMGLCNLKYIDENIQERKRLHQIYEKYLSDKLARPSIPDGTKYNYSYFPVIFENQKMLLNTFEKLAKQDIFPRRYFYPSLNTLPYIENKFSCPVSEDIAVRIACLPLYVGLKEDEIKKICELINESL